jgi:ABC-type branched-subunit amino acid transport system ATPase component
VFDLFPRAAERRQQKAATRCPAASSGCSDRPRPDGRAGLLLLDEPSLGLRRFWWRTYAALRRLNAGDSRSCRRAE